MCNTPSQLFGVLGPRSFCLAYLFFLSLLCSSSIASFYLSASSKSLSFRGYMSGRNWLSEGKKKSF